jgi:ribosomal protein S25
MFGWRAWPSPSTRLLRNIANQIIGEQTVRILNTDNPIIRPVGDEVTREKMVTRMALTDGIKDIQVSN